MFEVGNSSAGMQDLDVIPLVVTQRLPVVSHAKQLIRAHRAHIDRRTLIDDLRFA